VDPLTEHTGVPPLHPADEHPPQWACDERSTSQPLDATPSQSANPALHAAMAHPEFVQLAVAWASEHTCPQVPQFAVSVVVLTSQPVEAIPSQSE
jgi:hypothetical protein